MKKSKIQNKKSLNNKRSLNVFIKNNINLIEILIENGIEKSITNKIILDYINLKSNEEVTYYTAEHGKMICTNQELCDHFLEFYQMYPEGN